MPKVFENDDDLLMAGALAAVVTGLRTHSNPRGEEALDAVMSGLDRSERAAVNYALAAHELAMADRAKHGKGQ
jgi:hypothetical protein